jgi:hypothetical protein
MSQRIKELEQQAEKFVMSIPASLDINEYTSVFNEKFAELIIDECCSKLLDLDQKANGYHNYYKYAAIEIKRSFE